MQTKTTKTLTNPRTFETIKNTYIYTQLFSYVYVYICTHFIIIKSCFLLRATKRDEDD